jgi:alginate O-acetyltransferase complex protein AlgI
MVLNSPIFIFLFLPAVLALYFAAPSPAKNPVLLAVSLLFYAWGDGSSIFVLLFSVGINYAAGLLIQTAESRGVKRAYLSTAIFVDVALLFFYKYLKFAVTNLASLHAVDLSRFDFTDWHLPPGISFFTFAALAYLLDIYRGKTPAERNPIDLGLYVALFPKIIAGPIVRYSEICGELKRRRVTLESFGHGARRFVIGLGKKVLIANQVAIAADAAFSAGAGLDAPTAWVGILCYTLQIYFDFSGYSDMAIGLGRMLGFTFLENFNYPYVSQSIQEFWRRWHISLSTWFRDYLYIPLGGSRGSPARTYVNLVVVFLLCGFWHGASWNFIVWGIYHGAFLVLERLGLVKALKTAPRPLRHAYGVLTVMVGWVFFRAADLTHAVSFLDAMFSLRYSGFDYFRMTFLSRQLMAAVIIGVAGSVPVPACVKALRDRIAVSGKPWLSGFCDAQVSIWTVVFILFVFMASVMELAMSTYSPFIYTKF